MKITLTKKEILHAHACIDRHGNPQGHSILDKFDKALEEMKARKNFFKFCETPLPGTEKCTVVNERIKDIGDSKILSTVDMIHSMKEAIKKEPETPIPKRIVEQIRNQMLGIYDAYEPEFSAPSLTEPSNDGKCFFCRASTENCNCRINEALDGERNMGLFGNGESRGE